MKHGNINNSFKEFNFNNKTYLHKNFNQSDSFYRKRREIAFYKYIRENKIRHVPNFFIRKNSLYIEKVYPNNKLIRFSKYLDCLIKFIKNLNKNSHSYKFYARENLIQKSIFSRIEDRILKIEEGNSVFKKIHYYKKLNNLRKFQFSIGNQIVISPSDIGLHNFLYTNHGPYFIDFEYSGKDKLIKLVLDLVLHPANGLKTKDYIYFVNKIYKSITGNNEYVDSTYISIFSLWWTTRLECSLSSKNIEKKLELGLLSKKDRIKYINNRIKLIQNYENISKRYHLNK